MFSKIAVALVAASVASAQTWTECNPLETTCPNDPAVGKKGINCDFTQGACDAFHAMDGTPVTYDSRGALAQMKAEGQSPTLRSDEYIFFGRVEVEMQAAAGKGIVTSIVLLSDDLDEVDFETVGYDNEQIQSNYFSKGDDSTFDRGGFHPVNNVLGEVHSYVFDWTPEKVEWFINGASVRTLKRSDVGDAYPQSPMQIKLGAWVAGYKGNSPGTIEWVGGVADFSNGPSTAIYKSIKVVDYAGGSSATDKNIKEYVYGDHSGSAKSIQIKLQDGSATSANEISSGSSSSSSASASSSSSTSSSKSTEKSTTTEETTSSASSTETAEISSAANITSTNTISANTTSAAPTSSASANVTSSLTTTTASKTSATTSATTTPSSAAAAGAVIGAAALLCAALAI